jgi:hypothetical protein
MPIIRDKKGALFMARDMAKRIRQRIYGHGRGWVFNSKDFQDMASLVTVRQVLGRLTKQGTIRRLLQGVYDYPAFNPPINTMSSPDPGSIARAIARANGWTILPTGYTALNLLGLSTQVPAQYQYFSDGPSKKYEWKGGTLAFKHRTNKETTNLSSRTALLVQALKNLGADRVDDSVMASLREKFSANELNLAVKEAKYSTSWVYKVVKQLAAEKKTRRA